MMNATHYSSFRAQASLAFRCGAVLLFGVALVAAQTRPQSNSNKSGKRQHVTTLRSSDSPEGSRVAINSDQSLSDYEAYRRGDRFYVKLPAADVPRAEATRGRGFADVKVQRGADSTVISFRLQPGTTAHVEQRSNKLDVVFSAPGTARVPAAGSNAGGRESARINPAVNSARTPARPVSSPSPVARNVASNNTLPKGSERSGSKLGAASPPPKTIIASVPTPTPAPVASPKATPSPKAAAAKPTASPGIQSTPATTATSSETTVTSWQSQMKERARYWILLAQLNPIPIVIGAVILALFLLFLFQRRRLKGTRRVRPRRSELKKAKAIADAASVRANESKAEAIANLAVPATVAAAVATSARPAEEAEPVIETSPAVPDSARQARVAAVAEQVKNVMAGDEYDSSVIGSNDRETRQLVGAELLSALVGRNLQRRDRARAAFMNHGYFDDATRDLRIADAPVERAAAARRLSFVHDREATPHLIAALDDSAPEVRRTAVEALMDLRDPAAIGPLNSLMQTETDRKVPRTLIKHAIDACATAAPADGSAPSDVSAATPAPQLSTTPTEPEREVIEL
jgi:hypothetical protein